MKKNNDEKARTQIFSVRTQFIFDGHFFIKAINKLEAKEYVEKHCGLVIGGDIHSSLPNDTVD
jgi:hypothetical protein